MKREVLRFVYLSDQGAFGFILAIGATIILAFLLFGNLLSMGNGGQKFMDVAASLVGKTKGGIAKVSVVSSALVGSISGSPTANVMITGSFTIPAMKKSGYSPVYAGAVEAT
nr:TRAP transporter large permease subunit [Bacillota bacterium]